MSQISLCMWFLVIFIALLCQDAKKLVTLKSDVKWHQVSEIPICFQDIGPCGSWQMHSSGTHWNSKTYVGTQLPVHCSLSGSGPALSAHTTQIHFLHFPPFWFGSICSHSARGWRYYWTPKVEGACILVTFVKYWMCVLQILTAKMQEM